MKILITGSRKFNDNSLMDKIINEHVGLLGNTVIHGGAVGVDSVAENICKHYKIKTIIIRPVRTDIKSYYLHRNAEMVGLCDEIIAIWDGVSRGTKFTIDYAKARGKKVTIIKI